MSEYKTLMGTPTNEPPSKERQYNIDAYKKAKAKVAKGKAGKDKSYKQMYTEQM